MNKIKELNDMFWDNSGIKWNIPNAGSKNNAVKIFKKNLATIAWNSLSTLERNPTNLPQTETILKGQSVSGISIDDLLQVKNYGDAAKLLSEMILDGSFGINTDSAAKLHNLAGKEEALEWGVLRKSQVHIGGTGYTPPSAEELPSLMQEGFKYIESKIEHPEEKAVVAFLFMSRSQPFYDANKRTSSLMMNGILMQNGLYPITVLNRDSEEFHTKLTDFYNTGNATNMLKFMEKTANLLYNDRSIESTKKNDREPEM